MLSDKAKRPAKKMRFVREKDEGARKKSEVKHGGDANVRVAEREQRGGCFWMRRTVHDRELGIFMRGENPSEKEGGARRDMVRPNRRGEFFVKGEHCFARGTLGGLERRKERGR